MNTAKPRLLLHACCAPCSPHAIETLDQKYDVELYFYNPNIHPADEYWLRVKEMKRLAADLQKRLIIEPYDVDEWFRRIAGLEEEPERGKRCEVCFAMRFEKTAQTATQHNINFFTTTLTISTHKDAETINRIGKEIAGKFGITFLEQNLKKQDGVRNNRFLSKKYNFYHQNYCGCIYSRRQSLAQE